jgi:adenylate cyclase
MSGSETYLFGDYTLDLRRRTLLKAGAEVFLRPKSFEVLCQLVANHGAVVSKQQLLDQVWGHTVVTEDSVTQCVIDVRRAIGDATKQVIRTVPRRGYVFSAPVYLKVEEAPDAMPGESFEFSTAARAVTSRLTWLIGALAGAGLLFGGAVDRRPHASASVASESPAPQFDVDYVLEGSVRRVGERVRVTAQLVDAGSHSHVWSNTYDRDVDDVFAVQDDIASHVANALQASLARPAGAVRAPPRARIPVRTDVFPSCVNELPMPPAGLRPYLACPADRR